MDIEVDWILTSVHVYNAIYVEHRDELTVFGSRTECAEEEDDEQIIDTEWGFKGAGAPLIRSERRGTRRNPETRYFIARVIEMEEP